MKNEASYKKSRFKAVLPHGEVPLNFAIVTACNPEGNSVDDATNQAATEQFQALLDEREMRYFPVIGGSAQFDHAEPGFGIVAPLEDCLELGRSLRQEAIFWVVLGEVSLVDCSTSISQVIGNWQDLAETNEAKIA